ncbi:MAG: hypothetical protein ABF661_06315 [Oenococcus sp.]|uniref:hypothetical protein n=1 Tax=Oenococcus sp. TaxID=1979414 RepID=UPI0039E7E8A0
MKKFFIFLGLLLIIASGVYLYANYLTRSRSDRFQQLQSQARQDVTNARYPEAKRALTDSLDFVVKQAPIEKRIRQISSFQLGLNFLRVQNYSDAITTFQKVASYRNGYQVLADRSNDNIKQANVAIDKQKAAAAAAEQAQKDAAAAVSSAAASSEAAAKAAAANIWTRQYTDPASIPTVVVDQARKNLQEAGADMTGMSDENIRKLIVAAAGKHENIVTYVKENQDKKK